MFSRINADIVDYLLTLNGFDVVGFLECVVEQTKKQIFYYFVQRIGKSSYSCVEIIE